MKPVVIIPWRGGDPHREAAFSYVRNWIASTQLPWTIVDADPSQPFNRAASKNHGVWESSWADVFIFNDADMIIPKDHYRQLVEMAWDTRNLTIGYVEYCALDEAESQAIYRGGIEPFADRHRVSNVAFSLGGVIAIHRDAFEEIGWYDERFQAWGCEDFALAIGAHTVCGTPLPRLEGQALHFFHEHSTLYDDEEGLKANAELYQRYTKVENEDDLRQVQKV